MMLFKRKKKENITAVISKEQAYTLISQLYLQTQLLEQREIGFIFKSSLPYLGSTDNYCASEIIVQIKCPKNFVDEKTQRPKQGNITLDEFVPLLVAALHEQRHIIQVDTFRHRNTCQNSVTPHINTADRLNQPKLLLQMSVIEFAHYGNPFFKEQIYPYNPNEIDAEQYGIRETRKLLSKIFPKEIVDTALLKYIYNRIHYFNMHPSEKRPDCVYYGITYQNDIEAILSSFDSKFQDSITCLPDFQYPENYADSISPEYRDFFYSAMYEMPDRIQDYHFNEFTNTFDKSKLMVYLNYKQNGLFHYIDERAPIYHEPWLHDWKKLLPQKDNRQFSVLKAEPEPNTSILGKQQIQQVKEDPMCIESMENPCQEAQIIAVQKEPLIIQCIENPCEEAQLIAIQQHPNLISKINNPTKKVKKLANDLQLKEYFSDVLPSKSNQESQIAKNTPPNRDDGAI